MVGRDSPFNCSTKPTLLLKEALQDEELVYSFVGCHCLGVRLLTGLMTLNGDLVHILKQIQEAGKVVSELNF